MADGCVGVGGGRFLVAQQRVAGVCVLPWFGVFEFGRAVHHLKQPVLLCEPMALPQCYGRVLCGAWLPTVFGVFGGQRHDDAFGVVDSVIVVDLPISRWLEHVFAIGLAATVFFATDILDFGAVELDGDVFCGGALAQNTADHRVYGAIAVCLLVWLVGRQRLCDTRFAALPTALKSHAKWLFL